MLGAFSFREEVARYPSFGGVSGRSSIRWPERASGSLWDEVGRVLGRVTVERGCHSSRGHNQLRSMRQLRKCEAGAMSFLVDERQKPKRYSRLVDPVRFKALENFLLEADPSLDPSGRNSTPIPQRTLR